jgi:hypothetical protein
MPLPFLWKVTWNILTGREASCNHSDASALNSKNQDHAKKTLAVKVKKTKDYGI